MSRPKIILDSIKFLSEFNFRTLAVTKIRPSQNLANVTSEKIPAIRYNNFSNFIEDRHVDSPVQTADIQLLTCTTEIKLSVFLARVLRTNSTCVRSYVRPTHMQVISLT